MGRFELLIVDSVFEGRSEKRGVMLELRGGCEGVEVVKGMRGEEERRKRKKRRN